VLQIPEVVKNKATTAGASQWLAELPKLLSAIEQSWSITVGRAYSEATEAFVCEATLNDSTPCVLKLMIPREGDHTRNEIKVLEILDGEGCVAMLDHDETIGSMLLERLGPSLHSLGLPIARRHEILCDCVMRVWRPAPDCGLPTGAEKAAWLADFIVATWEALDRPCGEKAVDYAISCIDSRSRRHDDERAVLVHGDVHEWNTLQSGHGFKLIDPDGLLAEAEYDLGVLMREDPLELLEGDPFDRALWLANRCQLDATAIWEWGVIERVSTGLLATQVGMEPLGSQMLHVAEIVAP
jgi:streptomycin 6-kinase